MTIHDEYVNMPEVQAILHFNHKTVFPDNTEVPVKMTEKEAKEWWAQHKEKKTKGIERKTNAKRRVDFALHKALDHISGAHFIKTVELRILLRDAIQDLEYWQ